MVASAFLMYVSLLGTPWVSAGGAASRFESVLVASCVQTGTNSDVRSTGTRLTWVKRPLLQRENGVGVGSRAR